jgi:formate hydrogenlyase subunit 6/NADH:ubiquinone oxidoreductase subunit I
MADKRPKVNEGRCLGCGVCAAGCPSEAIVMERKRNIPDPPATILEYGMRLLQEQGKLEAFLEVSTPKFKQG